MPPDKGRLTDRGNQFKLLDSDSDSTSTKRRKIKKQRNNNNFSTFFSPTPAEMSNFFTLGADPKYVILKADEKEKNKITKINPFMIKKTIEGFTRAIKSFKPPRDDAYLILVGNTAGAEKIIKGIKDLGHIGDIKCVAAYHERLNCSQGTIRAPLLRNLSPEEIVEGLKENNPSIIKARHLTRQTNNSKINTGTIHLTFSTYNAPKTVNVLYEKVEVKTWYPSPLRCRKYFVLGHHEARCNSMPVCPSCGKPKAPAAQEHKCDVVACISCGTKNDHTTLYRRCPAFLREKEIVKLQTDRLLTRFEARKMYFTTMAAPTTSTNMTSSDKTATQTGPDNAGKSNIKLSLAKTFKQTDVSYAQAFSRTIENITPKLLASEALTPTTGNTTNRTTKNKINTIHEQIQTQTEQMTQTQI